MNRSDDMPTMDFPPVGSTPVTAKSKKSNRDGYRRPSAPWSEVEMLLRQTKELFGDNGAGLLSDKYGGSASAWKKWLADQDVPDETMRIARHIFCLEYDLKKLKEKGTSKNSTFVVQIGREHLETISKLIENLDGVVLSLDDLS